MRAPLLALLLVTVAPACQTPRSAGGSARTVEGRVEEVGKDDGTLTLRVGEERKEILVAPEAEIRIDDFRGSFADLKEGQRVRASVDETGLQREGFRIQILDQGATAQGVTEEEGAAPSDVEGHPDAPGGGGTSADREPDRP